MLKQTKKGSVYFILAVAEKRILLLFRSCGKVMFHHVFFTKEPLSWICLYDYSSRSSRYLL